MSLPRALPAIALLLFACSSNRNLTSPSIDPVHSTLAADRTAGLLANGTDQATITATVVNPLGAPLAGLQLIFTAQGAGAVMTTAAVTDASGRTTARLSSTAAGSKTVTAAAVGGSALTQTVTVKFVAGPAAKLAFSVPPSSAQAGATIAPPVQLSVEDSYGNLVADAGSTIALAIATDGGSGLLAGTLSVAANSGIANFPDLSIAQAGHGYALTAAANGLASAVSPTFDVTTSAPAALAFTVQPSGVVNGAVIAPPVQVSVNDASGNLITSETATVTLALGGICASANGSALLSGTLSVAAVSGVATFSDLSIDRAARGCTLVATSAGFQGASSAVFDVNPGSPCAGQSTLTATPASATADGTSPIQLDLTLHDCAGDVLGNEPVSLAASGNENRFSVASGATSASGTFSTTLTSTAAGTSTITATVGFAGAAIPLTTQVVFTPGTASANTSTLDISPATLVADGLATAAITLIARDVDGNPYPGASVSLSASGSNNQFAFVSALDGGQLASGVTDAAGSFTSTLASTRAETKIVTATLTSGNSSVTLTAPVTFIAGAPSLTGTLLTASPNRLFADGTSTAALLLIVSDANGNPLSGEPVAFTASGGGNTFQTTSGATNAGGSFSSSLASTQPGQEVITATIGTGNAPLLVTTDVTFISTQPVPAAATITASPTALVADGSTTTTITAAIKDASGTGIAGQAITLSASGSADTFSAGGNSGSTASGTTGADGTFSAKLSSTRAGTEVVTAASGLLAASTGVLFSAGPPSAAKSSLQASPATLTQGASTNLQVTLADANGNPVTGKAVTLSAGSATHNTFSATGLSSGATITGTTNGIGQFIAALTSSDAQSETITATVDGSPLLTTPVTFSRTQLVVLVTASAATVIADGTTATTLTATVRDGNGVAQHGAVVQLSATGSANVFAVGGTNSGSSASGTTDSSTGKFTATLVSTKAEAKSITAQSGTASATTTVSFVAGPPSLSDSIFVASPATVTADGTTTMTLFVQANDANGNEVRGLPVSLSSTGSANTFSATSGNTGATGVFSATLSSTHAESKRLTANLGSGGAAISLSASVAFVPTTTQPVVSISAGAGPVVADGTTTTITVTVTDNNGNALSGQTVALSATGAANTFATGGHSASTASGATLVDGTFTATLSSTKAETKRITAVVGATSSSTAVTFVAGPASAAQSSLTASPQSVPHGGTISLWALLGDANGNPVSNQAVTLAADGTANLFSAPGVTSASTISGTTNAGGLFSASLVSTQVQQESVKLTLDSSSQAFLLAPVTFAATADSLQMLLVATPAEIIADGTSAATLTATVADPSGNAVSGVSVTIHATGSNNKFNGAGASVTGTTDSSGNFSATFTSTTPETKLLTAGALATTASTTVTADPINHCLGVTCTATDQCHVAGVCDHSTGICSNPSASDGLSCNDGNANTSGDICTSGICAGIDHCIGATCTASDQCHVAGVCNNHATGACSNPTATDGTSCNDGNANTTGDICTGGNCAGIDHCIGVTCAASDQCHVAGVCTNHATGACSNPTATDGTSCNDSNANTTGDICTGGICAGVDHCIGVICTAADQCHVAGVCTNHATGACSNPTISDGTACNDGNGNTVGDICTSGICAGIDHCIGVTCTASDQCHVAGVCTNHTTGACSNPIATDGTSCNDSNANTTGDICTSGVCAGIDHCIGVTCTPSDQCHVSSCTNHATGACNNVAATDGTACDAGVTCTANDTCTTGVCNAGPPATTALHPATVLAVGVGPLGMAAGDFNHDGKLDLASGVYTNTTNSVEIDLGIGDGTFSAPSTYSAHTYIADILTADFNGDGVLDLAIVSGGQGYVDILFGNAQGGHPSWGNGTFTSSATYATSPGNWPWSIAAGDFNADGFIDLAVPNIFANTITLLTNNDAGVFTTTNIASSANYSRPSCVRVADFDHDGGVDMVIANESNPGSITLLLNDGTGHFPVRTDYLTGGSTARTVAIGDLNGDGYTDIIASVSGSNELAVFLNWGATGGHAAGTFRPAVNYATGNAPYWVGLVDVNHDGFLDAVYTNTNDGTMGMRYGRGDGTFGPAATFPVASSPQAIITGDFDGDGYPDIIVSDSGSNEVSIFVNQCHP